MNGIHAQSCGSPRGHLHLFGCPLTDTLGVPVTPDAVGKDVAVAGVDRIVADRLPREMIRYREDGESVPVEDLTAALDVVVVFSSSPDVEVISPTGDLQALISPTRQRGGLPPRTAGRPIGR